MRTLIQVLQSVEVDFYTDKHLDLEPYTDPIYISGTSVPRATTGDGELMEMADLDTQIVQNLLKTNREKREAELLKPVTRVEVELVDNHFGDDRWNVSFADLDTLTRSAEFQSLSQTAADKGFGFSMHAESHLNRRQVLSLRITLIFKSFEAFKYKDLELLHGEEGRTHRWYEHP